METPALARRLDSALTNSVVHDVCKQILEPSHGYRKCGKAFSQLKLAHRALQVLERQPYISYLDAVSKVLDFNLKVF